MSDFYNKHTFRLYLDDNEEAAIDAYLSGLNKFRKAEAIRTIVKLGFAQYQKEKGGGDERKPQKRKTPPPALPKKGGQAHVETNSSNAHQRERPVTAPQKTPIEPHQPDLQHVHIAPVETSVTQIKSEHGGLPEQHLSVEHDISPVPYSVETQNAIGQPVVGFTSVDLQKDPDEPARDMEGGGADAHTKTPVQSTQEIRTEVAPPPAQFEDPMRFLRNRAQQNKK